MASYLFATEEQRDLADSARFIVEKELKDRIEEYESSDNGLGTYPRDVHNILVESGYFATNIPEEWGGLGLDLTTQVMIIEEIAKVDAGFAFSFAGSGCYWDRIEATGMPQEEKQMWAEKILSGTMGCFALTESDAGSDAAAMRTTAVRDGDEWVINGTKCFASNAPCADYFIIFAWTDKSKRASEGVTAFFVEKDRGVKIGKKENKMGLHLSETAEVVLEDVRVPNDHIVGSEGMGFKLALGGIAGAGSLVNCAPLVGLGQAAIDTAVDYAKQRRQFGKRIIDHQGVGFMIADMMMRESACRAMLYDAVRAVEQHVDQKISLDLMTKCYISENVFKICDDAIQVLGGYGYMKDYPVERYMRNARIFRIFGGTNQIKKKNIMKAVAGRDPKKQ